MAPRWFLRLFTAVPILTFATSLINYHFQQKLKLAPVYPSKQVMSAKTTQLGGTASDVTVGKIGVSVPALILSLPDVDPSPDI